ncbi:hypothetical protein [uncultured Amnibacterium sp.]|uniref:hypothetical protein n=1 Tax=uncultured Amnibacterium sp. TaxID=1631851 RepID=UPI0035CB2D71
MDAQPEVAERSPWPPLVASLLALGVVRTVARIYGLVALLVIVIACVGAMAIAIVVLRLMLLH